MFRSRAEFDKTIAVARDIA